MSTATSRLPISEPSGSTAVTRAVETIPATLLLTALTCITAIGFCRVFSGWEFLGPMLVVVIGTHLVSFLLRVFNVPGYFAVPATLLVVFSLVAWKYYPSTMAGPFPSWSTWDVVRSDLQLSRDQFQNAVAPVAAIGGFIITGTTACGFAAMLGDAFAFRAYGRAEAVVPSAVLFIFAAALGVDNHRVVLSAAWLLCAVALIGVLRAAHSQTEQAWIGPRGRVSMSVIPLIGVLAAVAALGAIVIGPSLPGAGAKALIKTSKRNDVTEVLSPLVDIRSRLINLAKVEMFTVEAGEPHYWRYTGLTRFNGTTWSVSNDVLKTASGTFAEAGGDSHDVLQRVRISALKGNLLPAAYSASAIDDNSDAYWVDETGTLVVPSGIARGDQFEIVSSVLDVSPELLRSATSVNPPDPTSFDLPGNFPDEAADAAIEITANAPTVYDKARALQDWFQNNFEYDLSVQRGHGNNAIKNFLRIKRGYCEQFAGTFAAMARSLGIPARVAVGFTYGDLRGDGKYHVYGRNAHAWPEVWFDDVGWISFEPTPGRGQPGTEDYTGVAPDQAPPPGDSNNATPATTPDPAVTTTLPGQPGPSTTVAGNTTVSTTIPAVAGGGGSDGGGPSPWMVVFGLLLVGAVAWVLFLPRITKSMQARRRGHTPTDRIEQSWTRATSSLGLLGLAPRVGETPIEHAKRVERTSGIDRRTLRDLAAAATAAIYGDVGDEKTADRCENLTVEVIGTVRRRLSFTTRIAVMFDPRRADLISARA